MASDADMKRLHEALRTDGERVEIHRHHDTKEHVAHVVADSGRTFECDVSAGQVLELEQLGAKIF